MTDVSQDILEKISGAVRQIGGFMNLQCQVTIREEAEEKGALLVSVYAPESARFLIGRDGQNLQSLEQVLRAMFLKDLPQFQTIAVDVNDYRKTRAAYLVGVAKQAVMKVRNTQKAEALAPMPASERRIIHMELAAYPDIATESIGQDPQRRIVIKPYP